MNKNFRILFLLTLVLLSAFVILKLGNPFEESIVTSSYLNEDLINEQTNDVQTNDMQKENSTHNTSNNSEKRNIAFDSTYVNVPVNVPTELSGKSKKYIYKLRKNFVDASIFASSSYEPSESIFGQIEDGKPWVSFYACVNGSKQACKTDGPSEETRFINNPTMLVAIEYPFFSASTDVQFCTDPITNLQPSVIKYSKAKNEIVVIYDYLPFTTNNNFSFYTFNGINARDFGYQYAYIDVAKSSYMPDFMSDSNMSTDIITFVNYIHVGGACRVEGGCNNGSPRQSYLEFKANVTEFKYQNREIYIKLWKERPASPAQKPDIVERIILKWS